MTPESLDVAAMRLPGSQELLWSQCGLARGNPRLWRTDVKKVWQTPELPEQSVGLEVTSYASAEIDPD